MPKLVVYNNTSHTKHFGPTRAMPHTAVIVADNDTNRRALLAYKLLAKKVPEPLASSLAFGQVLPSRQDTKGWELVTNKPKQGAKPSAKKPATPKADTNGEKEPAGSKTDAQGENDDAGDFKPFRKKKERD